MADYHPLIARAVAGLDKNTGENRRALYERARTALVAQLRGVVPALEESEITRERLALEEAIRKVEAESARHARETARPTFIKRAEAPKRDEPPRPEQPARPAVGPARPGSTTSTVMPRPAARSGNFEPRPQPPPPEAAAAPFAARAPGAKIADLAGRGGAHVPQRHQRSAGRRRGASGRGC
jgi:hypothetical protein